jgi:hypothetical protein
VALDHASDGDDGLTLSVFLAVAGFDYRVDRFLLRRVDEAAGVHENDIGVVCVGGETRAAILELSDIPLRIDRVLVAAQRDQRELHR